MKLLIRIFCLTWVTTFIIGSTAFAGLSEYGHGARAVAMGQAQVAASNDASAIVYNPAALIQARDYWDLGPFEPYISIMQIGTAPDLTLNGIDQLEGYGPATDIFILIPVMKRVVLGVNVFLAQDKLLTVDLFFPPGMGRWRVDNTFGLGTGIGIQVTKKLSVSYAAQSQLAYNASTLNLNLMPILAKILGLDLGSVSDINPAFELDIISHGSYKFGALYRPLNWLSLGFTYSYRNPSPVNIPIKVITGDLMGDIDVVVQQWSVSPTMVTGGIALFPVKGLTLAFDLTRALYSLEKNAGMRFVSDSSFGSDFAHVELRDVWWSKFGAEWTDDLKGKYQRVGYAVRAGYSYYPTPYPTAGSPENMGGTIDSDAYYYCGGLALSYKPFTGGLRKGPSYVALEYFYEYIDLVERTHKSITRNPAVIVSEGHVVYNGVAISMHF